MSQSAKTKYQPAHSYSATSHGSFYQVKSQQQKTVIQQQKSQQKTANYYYYYFCKSGWWCPVRLILILEGEPKKKEPSFTKQSTSNRQ